MVGLLAEDQKLMLGLVVWPEKVMPHVFSRVKEFNGGETEEQYLHVHRLHDILWDSPDALHRLFDICAGFFSVTTPHSYWVDTPSGKLRRNRRHLSVVPPITPSRDPIITHSKTEKGRCDRM